MSHSVRRGSSDTGTRSLEGASPSYSPLKSRRPLFFSTPVSPRRSRSPKTRSKPSSPRSSTTPRTSTTPPGPKVSRHRSVSGFESSGEESEDHTHSASTPPRRNYFIPTEDCDAEHSEETLSLSEMMLSSVPTRPPPPHPLPTLFSSPSMPSMSISEFATLLEVGTMEEFFRQFLETSSDPAPIFRFFLAIQNVFSVAEIVDCLVSLFESETERSRLLRAVKIVKIFIQTNGASLLAHKPSLAKIKDVAKTLAKNEDIGSTMANVITVSLSQISKTPRKRDSVRVNPVAPTPTVSRDRSLLDYDASEMARQLCLVDFGMLANIPVHELANVAWTKGKAPNIAAWADHSQKLVLFLVYSVLDAPNLKVKIQILEHLLRVGEELLAVSNYNGVLLINLVMMDLNVSKLIDAKKGFSKKFLKGLRKLQQEVDPLTNFVAYKAKSRSFSNQRIPILEAHLKDLLYRCESGDWFADESNKKLDLVKVEAVGNLLSIIWDAGKSPFGFITEPETYKMLCLPSYSRAELEEMVEEKKEMQRDLQSQVHAMEEFAAASSAPSDLAIPNFSKYDLRDPAQSEMAQYIMLLVAQVHGLHERIAQLEKNERHHQKHSGRSTKSRTGTSRTSRSVSKSRSSTPEKSHSVSIAPRSSVFSSPGLKLIRIAVVGYSGVGKTCLCNQFCSFPSLKTSKSIKDEVGPIIDQNGAKFQLTNFLFKEGLTLQEIVKKNNPDVVLGVYDLTDYDSFQDLSVWMDYSASCLSSIPVGIVANHLDEEANREVPLQKGIEFAGKYKGSFAEVSASRGTNAHSFLEKLISSFSAPSEDSSASGS
eukprot:TRINITY_DN429_c0_g1_i2.p1 TRINITY_DN429_c0_g1~~TRINITY_DN429_c0_g1_i2.p1  ORF type:complete len:821 (+),score=178.49 TRINITY_DN429_c0_g1_i2:121-2583(+)